MARQAAVGLGLIGCGGFGRFCLEAYAQMPQVRIVAVADVYEPAVESVIEQFNVPGYSDPAELISRNDVDIVHIAAPPAQHFSLAMMALRAGKSVLCEKPLALNTAEADQMLQEASQRGLILPVNYVLRYNAVTEAVKAVIDSGVLGEVLSARLTNCASDSKLVADHWFWDKRQSGGIFIEHGVHFFDLYRHWLDEGRVISAHAERRPGTPQEDRVTCLCRHAGGALASHYHGFDQLGALDRTDHRLVCQAGDIHIDGWIPLTMRVDAAVDEDGAETLSRCMGGAAVRLVRQLDPQSSDSEGGSLKRTVTRRVALEYTPQPDKQTAYADSVRALLADQIAYLHDHSHVRRVTERNGRDSLIMAESAARLGEG